MRRSLKLRVRGAPAIGIFAGYAAYVLARQIDTQEHEVFAKQFFRNSDYLNSARPTAVNLSWALRRMNAVVSENAGKRFRSSSFFWRKKARRSRRKISRCARRSRKTG